MVALERLHQPLAALSGQVQDEGRHLEARDALADMPLQVQRVTERRV